MKTLSFRRFGMIAVLLLLTACFALAQSDSKKLAVVNGEVFTEAEIRSLAKPDLDELELRRLEFDAGYVRDQQAAVEKAMNTAIEKRLIALEAKKRGMTEASLTALEVDSHVVAPTDKEVSDFYTANKAHMNGVSPDLATAYKQVREYLTQQRRSDLYAAFIATLKKNYNVETFIEPQRTTIETAGQPSRGPATAPVTMVVFSDFECPYCENLFPTLALLEKNYGDRLRVVYRQFPLTALHPHAQKAAEASLCANEQGKFWEMHDAMFSDQKNLTVDDLKKKALALKLDPTAFNTCLDSGKEAARVKLDIHDGAKAGVTGTPAMFINGRFLNGTHPYAEIAKIIDEELQKAQAKQ